MCDFSLVARKQRDYLAGERLIVTRFGPYTRGTASPVDTTIAVCLRTGACLMIPELPEETRKSFKLPDGELYALFMQLPNRNTVHRDALVFDNGRTILINDLPIGLTMTVHERRADLVDAAIPELALVASR